MVKLCCYYTTKYDITKVDIHAGEQLILNFTMSHRRTDPDVVLNIQTEAFNYSIDKCIKWVSKIA